MALILSAAATAAALLGLKTRASGFKVCSASGLTMSLSTSVGLPADPHWSGGPSDAYLNSEFTTQVMVLQEVVKYIWLRLRLILCNV